MSLKREKEFFLKNMYNKILTKLCAIREFLSSERYHTSKKSLNPKELKLQLFLMKINEEVFNETRLERSNPVSMRGKNSHHTGVLFFTIARSGLIDGDHKVALALLVTLGNKSHSDHVALLPFHVESEKKARQGEERGREKRKKTSGTSPDALESRITTRSHSLNHPFDPVSSFRCHRVVSTKAQPVTIMTMIIIRARHRGKEHSRRNLASITLINLHPGYWMPFEVIHILIKVILR